MTHNVLVEQLLLGHGYAAGGSLLLSFGVLVFGVGGDVCVAIFQRVWTRSKIWKPIELDWKRRSRKPFDKSIWRHKVVPFWRRHHGVVAAAERVADSNSRPMMTFKETSRRPRCVISGQKLCSVLSLGLAGCRNEVGVIISLADESVSASASAVVRRKKI